MKYTAKKNLNGHASLGIFNELRERLKRSDLTFFGRRNLKEPDRFILNARDFGIRMPP